MPNIDGTGPRSAGQFMGRCAGRRHHRGAGQHNAGCRCGFGPCAAETHDAKTVLEARRDALKRSLTNVEQRLEAL